jgi:hypothetical protein
MLEICPSGEEKNRFFIFPFSSNSLQKLCSHPDDKERYLVKLAANADRK